MFIVTCHYQKHLALSVLLCCVIAECNVSNCLSLLQNHATQSAEFIHTDLCTVWQDKFTGEKSAYVVACD
jgi:hypothetical protein